MKRHSIFYLFLFLFCLSGNAANYLISKKATTVGEIITHRGYDFKVGKSAFPDFESFLAANTEDNSIVYVADGTYSKDITITNCVLNGGYMGIELRETENITITNNVFNVADRNILLPVNTDCTYTGTITITGNVSNDAQERFVRADGTGDQDQTTKRRLT